MLFHMHRHLTHRAHRFASRRNAENAALRISAATAVLVISLLLLSSYAGKMYKVVGQEMEPTFRAGQTITAVPVEPQKIERGDTVIYHLPNGDIHFKRVIGLPGEMVSVSGGVVIVDGIALNEPYAIGAGDANAGEMARLASDEFYMLSDNRLGGYDSRHHGPIEADQIVGRVKVTWLNRLARY